MFCRTEQPSAGMLLGGTSGSTCKCQMHGSGISFGFHRSGRPTFVSNSPVLTVANRTWFASWLHCLSINFSSSCCSEVWIDHLLMAHTFCHRLPPGRERFHHLAGCSLLVFNKNSEGKYLTSDLWE